MMDAVIAPEIPIVLPVNFDDIPIELKQRHQWVLWNFAIGTDGKPTKYPYQWNGRWKARSNDPKTWSTYLSIAATYRAGGFSGIGFVFSADDPFYGVDFDGCRDPETGIIADWARVWIDEFNTYAEVSPSGTGMKLWGIGKSPLPRGGKVELPQYGSVAGKNAAVEVYDRLRYFAMTGHKLEGAPCSPC